MFYIYLILTRAHVAVIDWLAGCHSARSMASMVHVCLSRKKTTCTMPNITDAYMAAMPRRQGRATPSLPHSPRPFCLPIAAAPQAETLVAWTSASPWSTVRSHVAGGRAGFLFMEAKWSRGGKYNKRINKTSTFKVNLYNTF